VMKTFSIASALASGKYRADTLIDTRPGFLHVADGIIKDDHPLGVITVTDILKHSSDVGVSKIILSLSPKHYLNFLKRMGFGRRTNSHFPGEQAGEIAMDAIDHPFVLATLSFGYGVSVTALQLAHAYSIFATNGILFPIALLHRSELPQGKRILKPTIAKQMLLMLEKVVNTGGTGVRADVPGYRVAGKTGTARILGPDGYLKDHHIATFVGIAPVGRPRLVVAVVIRDPRGGKYYSSQVAAPVFSKVMAGALRILNVVPDEG